MSLIKKMRKQDAIYWEPSGEKDQFGKFLFLPPADIKCRWEDVQEQMLDENGKEVVYDSIVFVDRIVAVGGLLLKGVIAELESPEPPKGKNGAKRIRKVDGIPDLNVKEFLRIAYL